MRSIIYDLNKEDRKCLNDLWSSNLEREKEEIKKAKGGLLTTVYGWILEHPDFKKWLNDQAYRLLWIRGDPGKGKTMLLSVLRCLVRQLIDQQPSLISHLRAKTEIFADISSWHDICEIFNAILNDPALKTTFLVIDGLDECYHDRKELITKILQTSSCPRIKWIVSSRNWLEIQEQLRSTHQLSLELNAQSVSTAVESYIRHKVDELVQLKQYNTATRDVIQQYLIQNSDNTFLWVSLVCQNLVNEQLNPIAAIRKFPSGLSRLYDRMMKDIEDLYDADLYLRLLLLVTIMRRPITLNELSIFIDIPPDATNEDDSFSFLRRAVSLCGSFLILRQDTIHTLHQSAKDFLSKKAAERTLSSGPEVAHLDVFSRSLKAIASLNHDIFNLRAAGCFITEVIPPTNIFDQQDPSDESLCQVQKFFSEDYLHWLEALSLSRALPEGLASIIKLNNWLKATKSYLKPDLPGRVQDAYRFFLYFRPAIENQPLQIYYSGLIFSPERSIKRGEYFDKRSPSWISGTFGVENDWSDCLQTLEGHHGTISSLVFSHDSGLIVSGSRDDSIKIWDTMSGRCLQTLTDHTDMVLSVALSHDSSLLASRSQDGTIKIWNTECGKCLKTLMESQSVRQVVFSHDSKLLASTSDHVIKFWDPASGQCVWKTPESNGYVEALTFSHDSELFASCSENTVMIWDTRRGDCLKTLQGHEWGVRSVIFSHDSKFLVSGSWDSTIKIWNTDSGECLKTLVNDSDRIAIVLSHDSKILASSLSREIKLWDVPSGQCLRILKEHRGIEAVTFSHDSRLLASGSGDGTIKIWNPNRLHDSQVTANNDHEKEVNCVAFSRDCKLLLSGSDDLTIKIWNLNERPLEIWDIDTGRVFQRLKGHTRAVDSGVFSHDSRLFASTSYDDTIKIWDIQSGQCLQTLKNPYHRSFRALEFDATNSCLITNAGTLKLSLASNAEIPNAEPEVPVFKGYALSPNLTYVTWNSESVLWLPPHYRSRTFAISQSSVCFGYRSGQILILNFDSPDRPFSLVSM
ncbi:hypothetical protein N7528_009097 [Penicillium herquei]|nr:hypothetical protein N7528_009097 [Penicillium herquei]